MPREVKRENIDPAAEGVKKYYGRRVFGPIKDALDKLIGRNTPEPEIPNPNDIDRALPDSGSIDPVDDELWRSFCEQNPFAPNCSNYCP